MGDLPTAFRAPSSYLPPIRTLPSHLSSSTPSHAITLALSYIGTVYNPPVRGVRRISSRVVFPKPLLSEHGDATTSPVTVPPETDLWEDDALSCAHDSFERAYVVRWLTALVTLCSELHEEDLDFDSGFDSECSSNESPTHGNRISEILHNAAALLALCSGTAGAGVLTRHFSFSSTSPSPHHTPLPSNGALRYNGVSSQEIKVSLTDAPLENADYGSVGAQTWGASHVLSEMLVSSPASFGLRPSARAPTCSLGAAAESDSKPLRVLELGAGTGLTSLVAAEVLRVQGCLAEVVATDFYPSVLKNLALNIEFNQSQSISPRTKVDTVDVKPVKLDWEHFPSTFDNRPEEVEKELQELFDVILGADIIYELSHAQWIAGCVRRLLRRPQRRSIHIQDDGDGNEEEEPAFHLVIPLRKTHADEAKTVEEVFPFDRTKSTGKVGGEMEGAIGEDEEEKECDLRVVRKEVVLCRAEAGEVVEYVYYRIGWVWG